MSGHARMMSQCHAVTANDVMAALGEGLSTSISGAHRDTKDSSVHALDL